MLEVSERTSVHAYQLRCLVSYMFVSVLQCHFQLALPRHGLFFCVRSIGRLPPSCELVFTVSPRVAVTYVSSFCILWYPPLSRPLVRKQSVVA